MVKVIKGFRDKETKIKYKKGDSYPPNDEERVAFLTGKGHLGSKSKDEVKHVGGGWYELPNGQRIKGKEKALEALGGD